MNTTAVRRAIYGRLAGDTTLNNLLAAAPAGYAHGIYHLQAPEGARFPAVIFSKASGVPTDTFTKAIALEEQVWLVKAVDSGDSSDNVEAVAGRLDYLLNDASLSISGGALLYLRRQSDVDYSEYAEGSDYRHVGGNYRLVAEPS